MLSGLSLLRGRLQASFLACAFSLLFLAAAPSPAQATLLTFQWSGPIGDGEWKLPKRPAEDEPFVEFVDYIGDDYFLLTTFDRFRSIDGQYEGLIFGYQLAFYTAEELGGLFVHLSHFMPGFGMIERVFSLLGDQVFYGPLGAGLAALALAGRRRRARPPA